MGGRDDGGVLPRGADRVYGNTATRAETLSAPGASGTSCGRDNAQERLSLAAELQEHEALAYKRGHRIAGRLEYILPLRPKEQGSLQDAFQRQQTTKMSSTRDV